MEIIGKSFFTNLTFFKLRQLKSSQFQSPSQVKSSKVGPKNHPYLHLTDDNQIPRPSRVLVKFGEGPDFEFKGILWGLLNPGANPSAEEYFYTYQGYNLKKGRTKW